MTSIPHAVAASGLRKSYAGRPAVAGVDLLVAPGEMVALLGPNGAGKSTTVDMLLGLTTPDAGEVSLFGRPPREAVAGGAVGVMLQEAALPDDATVHETVAMICSLHRAPMPVERALRLAGVEDLAGRRAAALSGGQRQRVRLAMALAPDPGLLVLDEPTSAMDVSARRGFWHSMREYARTGRTVLFATHYLEEAETHADRVVLMRAGAIVADGPVTAVMARVGGRILRATVPLTAPATVPATVPATGSATGRQDLAGLLSGLPGVASAELDGERATLSCSDSDAALRALLARFPAARDIEVRAPGLEEAFVLLTEEPAPQRARVRGAV
ncbi:ABC transporter ATP-binding protein [Nonomuraea sp. 3-1Str]|uniref:ABC transporter ATP-binding protein n=1 Tax=Nonomuraea sp. 3-1Str TaxID=2929801 RepID=UPI002857A3FF|nr:ABC transporter ATP-binding protein [Nonomuraea sp. 3-1Str]MDR8414049.1 ABC transporter ATP-binding protein [Nonomuraea sp. 3-1Str]